jgi:hypothetical protein
MSDAQFPKPSGWLVNVWFPSPNAHSVQVVNPSGQPIPLSSLGQHVLHGLSHPKMVDLLVLVGKLLPTDSDDDALAKITGSFR